MFPDFPAKIYIWLIYRRRRVLKPSIKRVWIEICLIVCSMGNSRHYRPYNYSQVNRWQITNREIDVLSYHFDFKIVYSDTEQFAFTYIHLKLRCQFEALTYSN